MLMPTLHEDSIKTRTVQFMYDSVQFEFQVKDQREFMLVHVPSIAFVPDILNATRDRACITNK